MARMPHAPSQQNRTLRPRDDASSRGCVVTRVHAFAERVAEAVERVSHFAEANKPHASHAARVARCVRHLKLRTSFAFAIAATAPPPLPPVFYQLMIFLLNRAPRCQAHVQQHLPRRTQTVARQRCSAATRQETKFQKNTGGDAPLSPCVRRQSMDATARDQWDPANGGGVQCHSRGTHPTHTNSTAQHAHCTQDQPSLSPPGCPESGTVRRTG
jgi:hypothetical protein